MSLYPRTRYEMTEEDLQIILDACKPTVCIMVGSSGPSSPQENANRAWAELGQRMGFDSDTVQPIYGKGNRFFSAVPSENAVQREERLVRELEEKKKIEIAQITCEIKNLQEKLADMAKGSAK